MIAALIATGGTLDPAKPLWLIVVLGWVLPFLIWNWLIGIVFGPIDAGATATTYERTVSRRAGAVPEVA